MRVKRFGFGVTSDFNTIKSHINSSVKVKFSSLTELTLVQDNEDFEKSAQVKNKSQMLYLLLKATPELTPHFWF